MEDTSRANNNGILLPRGIVILSAVAVLCVIIDLIGGLIEYFQDDKLRIVRIITRCFSILGWGLVEWYIMDKLWETRKKGKVTPSSKQEE
ncbi:hypothetical protein QVO10_00305 [Bacteroides gallinaceum]|uniref:Uncharacterized protein n=1 Tax=Bacteroides gallinaceum TaxID=1462571 RepID=A0ABT7X184_9BACE|nr:hypothetical protein [Bacteroides gallinaceum]MDN0047843.1 hypothetical protein [Bacteroides gallinaceum]